MTASTRALLKSAFAQNEQPTAGEFESLIDTSIDGVSVTYTAVIVAPSGGDYTSITAALAAINDASESNRYRILVEPGDYVDHITLKSYVDIIGAGADVTSVSNDGTASESTLEVVRPHVLVSGIEFVSVTGGRYCVHLDTPGEGTFTLADCILTQNNTETDALGCGGRPGQTLRVENTVVGGTIGIHGVAVNRELGKAWRLELVGVEATELRLVDFLEYERNVVLVQGGDIPSTTYTTNESYYDDNPSDPLYNRGFQRRSIALITA